MYCYYCEAKKTIFFLVNCAKKGRKKTKNQRNVIWYYLFEAFIHPNLFHVLVIICHYSIFHAIAQNQSPKTNKD